MNLYDHEERNEKKARIRHESAKAKAIKDFLGSEGWKLLSKYLEKRYVEVADAFPCETPVDVANRNARLDEIRMIYRNLKTEFDASALNLRQLHEELMLDDEYVPTPWDSPPL